jgi:hypothetical protein
MTWKVGKRMSWLGGNAGAVPRVSERSVKVAYSSFGLGVQSGGGTSWELVSCWLSEQSGTSSQLVPQRNPSS